MTIIRIKKTTACNDNEQNPKKREHMQLIAFYLENKLMIEKLVDSLSEEERLLWFKT